MQELFREALSLKPSQTTFDLNSSVARTALAEALWSSHPVLGKGGSAEENAALATLLEVLLQNNYHGAPDEAAHEHRKALRLEGIFSNLQRAHSQKRMPLITARISVAAARCQLHGMMWRGISLLAPGVLASEDWTEKYIEFARGLRPACEYESLKGVGGAMFDNYTRKVLYTSDRTVEGGGYLLNMTNYASMTIPKMLAGPNFDASELCVFPATHTPLLTLAYPFCDARLLHCCYTGKKPLRSISMAAFSAQFLITNPQIVANKRGRFTTFLRACAAGNLFVRPNVQPRYVAHMTYHSPPMWGVLQSSYEDVEAELNQMRSKHLDKKILFVGGDGLSILRINHLLYKYPDLYLDSAPMIIPIQGEAPHGVYHVMHGGWRLYRRFIRAAADATLGVHANAVVDEPTVKVFNLQMYALRWMTRACSEYLLMLARTAGAVDIDQVPAFIQQCERNVDLAWVVHFLHDFAYLVLDFKQSVRKNDSRHLDVLWREFFATGYTGTANKTNYVPMSIMRIFWADALVPELAHLYHELRAIPMSQRTFVGWDTPIEWLNGAITDGVKRLVSEARIENFVLNYSFLNSNYAHLLDVIEVARGQHQTMRDMDANVDRMKHWLISHIGHNWATATTPNQNSQLGIPRGVLPWVETQQAMTRVGNDAVPTYVARCVRDLTNSFYGFLP